MSRDTILQEIAAERQRQVKKEGWSEEHDDEHEQGELADAAAFYASTDESKLPVPPFENPEKSIRAKRKNSRRRQLVIAAALIVAEIERLERAGEA
jgi:hypothetical protein